MTEDEAYKVHIQYTFNAFCKIVIRHAAIDKILKLRRRWEREVSLDYLMNEKFVQLAEPEQLEEYLFTACGQTAALYHAETGNLPSSRFWRKKGWRALCAERPFRCPSAKEKRKVPAHKAGAFAKRFCPLAKAPAFCCLFPALCAVSARSSPYTAGAAASTSAFASGRSAPPSQPDTSAPASAASSIPAANAHVR